MLRKGGWRVMTPILEPGRRYLTVGATVLVSLAAVACGSGSGSGGGSSNANCNTSEAAPGVTGSQITNIVRNHAVQPSHPMTAGELNFGA